ncbi:LIM domain-containing protein WLIM1 [Linum perenne]
MASFPVTQQKCKLCDKTVYLVDKLVADTRVYHKSCFRCHHCNNTLKVTVNGTSYHRKCFKCSHGGCTINPSNYIAHEGKLYCKHHHIQLFKEKGNYSQLENDNQQDDCTHISIVPSVIMAA